MICNLQALRAAAAWMVVLHHLRTPLGHIWAPLGDTPFFASGVDLFFVLSGYVMVVSTSGRRVSPLNFWRRRLIRIAPLYWAVTLALVLALAAGLNPVGINSWTSRDIAASFLFLGIERSDGYPGPLLGVGWTLAYEAFFYLIFGFALLARSASAGVIAGVLVALVAVGAALGPKGYAAEFYLAPLLLEFAMGVMIARLAITRNGLTFLAVGAGAMVGGALILSGVAPNGDLITPGAPGAIWRVVCFGGPAALIVAGAVAAERQGIVCRSQVLRDQGDASYALYLIHLPLIQIIEKALGADAALIAAPPVLAVAAHIIHQRWERPVLGLLRPLSFDLRSYRLAG